MQLKSSTDYAIRIVCYLASHNGMISTSELSRELCVSGTYIPKVAKKLKDANIIVALEGVKGGYTLAKRAACFSAPPDPNVETNIAILSIILLCL